MGNGKWSKTDSADLALDPNGYDRLDYVFDIADSNAAQAMIHHWSNGIFPNLPAAMVVPDGLLSGSRGAYAAQTGTVYLAESTTGDPLLGPRVLAEEVGHHLDELLNPGGDTEGDEGEFFSKVLFGDEISNAELARLRSENDRGFINLDGNEIAVELYYLASVDFDTRNEVQLWGDIHALNDPAGIMYVIDIDNPTNFSFSLSVDHPYTEADMYWALVHFSEQGLENPIATSIQYGANYSGELSPDFPNDYRLIVFDDRDYRYLYSADELTYVVTFTKKEPGNDIGSARDIGLLQGEKDLREFVGSADTDDYYRFEIANPSEFSLSLSGLSADADVRLLDSSQSTIASGTWSGSRWESFSLSLLMDGIYYVRVNSESGNTDYKLSLMANEILDGAGNSHSSAENIETSNGIEYFSDFVGHADTNDYYRFELDNPSQFSLSLSGLSADADVRLLDSSLSPIASSLEYGIGVENISLNLGSGIYYVRVYPYDGANTRYNLSFLFDEPGNRPWNALDIETLHGTIYLNEFIAVADEYDFYRFEIDEPSMFYGSLKGLPDDAQLILSDSGGTIIAIANTRFWQGSRLVKFGSVLEPGTYYAAVRAYDGANTDYNLVLTANEILDGAGNSPGSAENIETLHGTESFSDSVGSYDTNDYYRFEIDNPSNVSLSLSGLSADANVSLLDSSLSTIASSRNPGSDSESINHNLWEAGTYYVQVFPDNGGSTDYNLTFTANEIDDSYQVTWNNLLGYGLVDAADAVARAIDWRAIPFEGGGWSYGGDVDMIKVPEVRARGYDGYGVVVAVIDIGFSEYDSSWTNLNEIANNGVDDDGNGYIDDVDGWNFENDSNQFDESDHGSTVIETIRTVAPRVQIMPLQLGDGASASEAIRYAVAMGADVINMSWGFDDYQPSPGEVEELQDALRLASRNNVIPVYAAGNSAQNVDVVLPARFSELWGVSVGSVDKEGNFASYSNLAGPFGRRVHVVAPGEGLWDNGTSFAAPRVSGVVALMKNANPDISDVDVREILSTRHPSRGLS